MTVRPKPVVPVIVKTFHYTSPELANRLDRLPQCNDDESVPLDAAGGLGCQSKIGFSAGCSRPGTAILAA
jgi:hypothetical protein